MNNANHKAPPQDLLRDASLFLDFDGTLVELAEHPEAVIVSDRLVTLLAVLSARMDNRVVVVSGRSVAQLTAFLDPATHIVGNHGLEFTGAFGSLGKTRRPAAMAEVLNGMNALAAELPGLIVEDKPFGIALHFRQNPEAGNQCISLASSLAREHGLHLQPGKMMIEVRASGGDKGTAIRTLMQLPMMAGTSPVFIGDDHTDEPGFLAAQDLGGAGIRVGDRQGSAAAYQLADVDAVLCWLEAAVAEAR